MGHVNNFSEDPKVCTLSEEILTKNQLELEHVESFMLLAVDAAWNIPRVLREFSCFCYLLQL